MQFRFLHPSRSPLAVAALASVSLLGATHPAQAQSGVTLRGDESRTFSSGTYSGITTLDTSSAVIAGATVDFLESSDSSSATLSSGTVGNTLATYANSTATITGGTVDNSAIAHDSSVIDVLGGSIVNSVEAGQNGTINFFGGMVGNSVLAQGNGFLTVLGGMIGNAGGSSNDGTAVLAGGTFNSAYSAGNGNTFYTDGKAVAGAFAYDDSTMSISGGTMAEVVAYKNAHVIITGGHVGDSIETYQGGTIDLYGSNLTLSDGYVTGNLYEIDPSTGAGYVVKARFINPNGVGVLNLHNSAPPAATLDTLYQFDSQKNDGEQPSGGLVQGSDGSFYGVTVRGGKNAQGSVYVTSPSGAETTLYSFTGGSDGAQPTSPPTLGTDGNLYGTTPLGGTSGDGTVYVMTPAGKLKTLHSFSGADGATPTAALTLGPGGNFYGTTLSGGAAGFGTAFLVTPKGKLTLLHSFNGLDGKEPYAPLTLGSDGDFYGTTVFGGAPGSGNVYRMDSTGVVSQVYAFTGRADGANPYAGVTEYIDGSLYGLTYRGGNNQTGEAYKVFPSTGSFQPLYSFPDLSSTTDGVYPFWALTLGTDGNFYGTAFDDGANNVGTVFQLTPAGSETTLASLGGGETGANPYGPLLLARNGGLYGTTQYGGGSNKGTIYKLSVRSLAPRAGYALFVKLHPTTICGGNAKSYGVVTLLPTAPVGGAVVTLTSSDPAVATVPDSVTVSPGGTTATFRVSTGAVASNTPVTITARYAGVTSQTATLTLTPPLLEKATLAANTASSGATLTGSRIYLTGNAPQDTPVTLSSSSRAAVIVPSTEIILQGTNSHSFVIRTGKVTAPTLVTITATSGGIARSATLTILP